MARCRWTSWALTRTNSRNCLKAFPADAPPGRPAHRFQLPPLGHEGTGNTSRLFSKFPNGFGEDLAFPLVVNEPTAEFRWASLRAQPIAC